MLASTQKFIQFSLILQKVLMLRITDSY